MGGISKYLRNICNNIALALYFIDITFIDTYYLVADIIF